jgi:hypothetical protein
MSLVANGGAYEITRKDWGFMDGCWEPWLYGCAIDWEAWGAIATMLATIVALSLGVTAFKRDDLRRKHIARAHASSKIIRLGTLKANFVSLKESAERLADRDPSTAQLAELKNQASLGKNLISWEEAAGLATHEPLLGASVFRAIEWGDSVFEMAKWEHENHSRPESAEFRKLFIRVLGPAAQKGHDLAEAAIAAIEASE